MGLIYMLLGLGAMYEVMLYLVIHAIVKIFLFLVVGLIMVYCNNMQDVRWMGGLAPYLVSGFICYCGGAVALAG